MCCCSRSSCSSWSASSSVEVLEELVDVVLVDIEQY
jgi:hypothetical protein